MPRADFSVVTADELREIAELVAFLNARKDATIQPDAFKICDSNGEDLGWITYAHSIGWVFAPNQGGV
jgi:hypothetical protein